MEDDTNPESEQKTFDVEFTAAELYTLHGLLQYNAIDMEMDNAHAARGLAKHVHETIASEEFTDSMDEEMDRLMEQMETQSRNGGVMGGIDKEAFQ